ncbi:MAG: ParB/RepB/Spo0J family partition protein [Patescibacteria group bacterium]|nr:ParB/RepB/Spo0J family partition protein [Patescibacteria group bacterium]
MLGKGLESLIPKKNSDERQTTSDQDQRASQEDKTEYVPRHEHIKSFGSERPNINEDFRERVKSVQSHPRPVKQDAVFHIEVEKIKPNPYQPRRDFNEESLAELAQSIRELGIIQPLIVTKVEKETETGADVEYQLVAGERRLMAAKLAGLERVPAVVKQINLHRAKLEIALVENIQRSNLNSLERARGYARLQDEFGLTQRDISTRVGKSRETVANTLRLLNLPTQIQEALAQNKINESQARTLLAISDISEQNRIFQNLLAGQVSVQGIREEQESRSADPEKKYWERRLEEHFGAPVKVMRRNGKGKMVVRFHSNEEWRGILDKLLGSESE